MVQYITKQDILWLLCINRHKFEWHTKKNNIKPYVEGRYRHFYTFKDLIIIYYSVYKSKEEVILESKINYKEVKLKNK